MNPRDLDRLFRDVLAGSASAADRRTLDAWLMTHPDDRERFEGLRELHATLSRIPAAEPPADLEASVVAAIRAAGPRATVSTPANRPAPLVLRPWRRERAGFAGFALPFAAGLAAGVLVLAGWMGGLSPRPAFHADVAGSMVPPGETRDWRLALGSTQIEPRLWVRPGSSDLRLHVADARGLTVEVAWPADSRRVACVHAGLASGPWQLESDRLTWRPAASDEITIEFADQRPGTPLRLVLSSPDGRREDVLTATPAGSRR